MTANKRGQTLTEFVICLPTLVLLAMGNGLVIASLLIKEIGKLEAYAFARSILYNNTPVCRSRFFQNNSIIQISHSCSKKQPAVESKININFSSHRAWSYKFETQLEPSFL